MYGMACHISGKKALQPINTLYKSSKPTKEKLTNFPLVFHSLKQITKSKSRGTSDIKVVLG